MVKNLPAMQETQVRYLGQEDPLEKGMATHSSILIWRIPWTEEHSMLVRHSWETNTKSGSGIPYFSTLVANMNSDV